MTDETQRLKSMVASSSQRRESLMDAMTEDPTAGYRARPFFSSEILINQLPPYSHRTGELMIRSDTVIEFAFAVRNAALNVAEVEVKAKSPIVKAWVEKQWRTLWDANRAKMLNAKKWGFSCLQPVWKRDQHGLLHIDRVKDFHPWDVKALERDGAIVGATVKGKAVYAPQIIWQTFNGQYENPYGAGLLKRMYPPWYEKWMDHGAKKLGQQRMIKDAYIGDVFEYPSNRTVTMPNGNQIPWRDIVREMGERRLSGAALTIPQVYDDKNNKLVSYTPPRDIQGSTQIFDWEERLDKQILRGADVPLEVVEAQENGGFSGRSIPFMVVLSNCSLEFAEIVRSVEEMCLRSVAWLNFGGDPEFEIVPKSLVESFAKDASGSSMGGSAIGSTQGQQPQQQQPAQQSSAVQFEFDESKIKRDGDGKFAAKGTTEYARQVLPKVAADVFAKVPIRWNEAEIKRMEAGDGDEDASVLDFVRNADSLWSRITAKMEREAGDGDWIVDDETWDAIKQHAEAEWKKRKKATQQAAQFDLSADEKTIADAALVAAYNRVKQASKLLKKSIKGKSLQDPQLFASLETALRLASDGVGVELWASMNAGGLFGAAQTIDSIPSYALPAAPPSKPPSDPPKLTGDFDDDEPQARFPALEDAIQTIRSAPIDSGRTYLETAEKARQGAFAVTADLHDSAVEKLRSLLTETMYEGGGEEEFAAKVNAFFEEGPLSENHLRTIFRTNTAQAISGGQKRSITAAFVTDAFPYRRYYSTTDQRVRKEHIAMETNGLNGTAVYRADDPVWQEFEPPFDFGCRCKWGPYTVSQAARAGVKEAQEWIERAKAMAGSDDYHEFLQATAPTQPEHVKHPPYSANPAFRKL